MKLIISRDPTGPDLIRPYNIYFDDKFVKKLYVNKPVTLDYHTEVKELFIKIDWVKSQRIDLSKYNTEKKLKIKIGVNAIFKVSMVLMITSVLLWDLTHVSIFKYLTYLSFLIVIYFLSVGRKNYFTVNCIIMKN